MRVDFALFGERGGAHELLSTSLRDDAIALKVRGKTDRPSFAPPGHALQPYTSSFAEGKHYVFAKTFPHEQAARGGMVVTTALFLDLNDITLRSDIGDVLALLPNEPLAISPEAIDLSDAAVSESGQELWRPLAEALVTVGSKRTVVWLGSSFEEQLPLLWHAMWPETRRNFAYRLAFDPQDVSGDQLTIAVVPAALESRWSDFVIVQQVPQALKTPSGAAVLDVDEGKLVRAMKDSLSVPVLALRDIGPLANLAQTFSNERARLDELRSSLHTLGRLCSSPETGIPVKANLVDRTVSTVSLESDAAQIRAFRNLDLRPFASGEQLAVALRRWTAAHCLPLSDTAFLSASFEDLSTMGATFTGGIQDALRSSDPAVSVEALSRWQTLLPAVALPLLKTAIGSGMRDENLAAVDWKLSEPTVTELMNDGLLGSYPLTQIIVLAESLPLKAAIRHLPLERIQSNDRRLSLFLDHIDVKEAFSISFSGLDELHVLAAACIVRQPSLLNSVESPTVAVLLSLSSALEAGLDESQVDDIFLQRVLLALTESTLAPKIAENLWRLILQRIGSLLTFGKRASCWQLIPGALRTQFLAKTAEAWIDAVRADDTATPPERELEQAIIHNLRARTVKLASLPAICRSLSSLDEDTFKQFLFNRPRPMHLDRLLAESLGEIILGRHWRRVVESIYHSAESDPDLKSVLAKCLDLLGRFQRLRSEWLILGRQSEPTAAELWNSVEELAIELYPWGPGDHNIWERAGGDPSLIKVAASGSEAWHHVLTYARNGGCGDVTLSTLCKAMSREYRGNAVLQKLQEYSREQ